MHPHHVWFRKQRHRYQPCQLAPARLALPPPAQTHSLWLLQVLRVDHAEHAAVTMQQRAVVEAVALALLRQGAHPADSEAARQAASTRVS